MKAKTNTHETYIQMVRDLAVDRALELELIDETEAARLWETKLVYGLGLMGGYRGVTMYKVWANGHEGGSDVVEIAAAGEESWLQLAGTTVHELAHVLAGHSAGHKAEWKDDCTRLGLRRAKAAGMFYTLAALDPKLREQVYYLAKTLADGSPDFSAMFLTTGIRPKVARPCSAGIGSRGGTSRGPGSGSRLVKVTCPDCGYIARTTRKWLDEVGPPRCGDEVHGYMVEEVVVEATAAA